jgi:hypothetical protein
MRYKVLPFPRRGRAPRRSTVSPVIPRGAMMNGLGPVTGGTRPFSYLGPTTDGPAWDRSLQGYGAEYPNSSFLSGNPVPPGGGIPVAPIPLANKVTVRMRADPNAAPGFPGFFQWLANANPQAFQAAIAAVPPHLISATKVARTGGATLAGIYGDNFARRRGLGDTSDYSYYTGSTVPVTTSLTPATLNTNFDTGSVSAPATVAVADTGETTAAPQPSSAGAAQLISAITSAGQAIVTGVNQQTLFNTNLARAAAGLPPLTGSGSAITGVASDPTTLLLIGGGILAVVLVMSMAKKSA